MRQAYDYWQDQPDYYFHSPAPNWLVGCREGNRNKVSFLLMFNELLFLRIQDIKQINAHIAYRFRVVSLPICFPSNFSHLQSFPEIFSRTLWANKTFSQAAAKVAIYHQVYAVPAFLFIDSNIARILIQ